MSLTRRDFLALVGTSLAGAAAVATVGRTSATAGAAKVDETWQVAAVGAVTKGAVPITLRNQQTGEQIVVEACRRSGRPGAVAASRDFDLFVVNNGAGRAQTPRSHVVAARALARHLDSQPVQVPEPVLTMEARLSRHADLLDTNDDFVTG